MSDSSILKGVSFVALAFILICFVIIGCGRSFNSTSDEYTEATIKYPDRPVTIKIKKIHWQLLHRSDMMVIESDNERYCVQPINVILKKKLK